MATKISGDMSVFSLNATSYLANIENVEMTLSGDTKDSSPLSRTYERAQTTKRKGSLKASMMNVVSGSIKESNLDVSVFSIGGTDMIGVLQSGTINVKWTLKNDEGVAGGWEYPVLTKKDIEISGELHYDATSGAALVGLMAGAITGLSVAVDIVINSKHYTLPMVLTSTGHSFKNGDFQVLNVTLKGENPDTSTFISAPSGTTALIDKALNTTAAYAFSLTASSAGMSYSGNIILESLGIRIQNSAILSYDFAWQTQGTVTIA